MTWFSLIWIKVYRFYTVTETSLTSGCHVKLTCADLLFSFVLVVLWFSSWSSCSVMCVYHTSDVTQLQKYTESSLSSCGQLGTCNNIHPHSHIYTLNPHSKCNQPLRKKKSPPLFQFKRFYCAFAAIH